LTHPDQAKDDSVSLKVSDRNPRPEKDPRDRRSGAKADKKLIKVVPVVAKAVTSAATSVTMANKRLG